jgi:hypothetical protein
MTRFGSRLAFPGEQETPDEPAILIDGDPPGCRCTPECGAPCWIRPGLAPEGDEVCQRCGCDQ